MRKNLGSKPYVYPMPVFIIGSYDENGVADAMNAAWGSIAGYHEIALYLDAKHKTVDNILKRKAFSVSIADASHVVEADYVGVVSANQVADKVQRAGLHVMKSDFVDAPIFEEFLMTLECEMMSYDETSELMLGKIVNVSVDESLLDQDGHIDLSLFNPITYDPLRHAYIKLGETVGQAFHDGLALKK